MIEVIYSSETKRPEDFGHTSQGTLKNIRQIGKSSGRTKIYVEDSTMGFLQSRMRRDEPPVMALLGNEVTGEETVSLFITGAVQASKIEVNGGKLEFAPDAFTDIYDEAAAYFGKSTILGWFLPAYDMIAAYARVLGETTRLFLLEDPTQEEEWFYLREQERLTRVEGYYVYYQDNVQMQEYMRQAREAEEEARRNIATDKRRGRKAEPDSRESRNAVVDKETDRGMTAGKRKGWNAEPENKESRKAEPDKKTGEKEPPAEWEEASLLSDEQPRLTTFLYAASTVLAIVVLVVGITMISNYERMYEMQETIETIAGSIVNGVAQTEQTAGSGQQPSPAGEQTTDGQGTEPENTDTSDSAGTEDEGAAQAGNGVQTVSDAQAESGTQIESGTQAEAAAGNGGSLLDAAIASGVVEADGAGILYYTVQKGDTLLSISRALYGTEEQAAQILAANPGLAQNELAVGQKLLLPQ